MVLTYVQYLLMKALNYVGYRNYKRRACRVLGLWAFNSQFSLKETHISFFTEGFFELIMCQFIHWNFMSSNSHNFRQIYFSGVFDSIPVLIAVGCLPCLFYVCLYPLRVFCVKKGEAYQRFIDSN